MQPCWEIKMAIKSLDGVLTKKSHTQEKFTEEQVKDLIACADPELGYLHFARKFFYIQHAIKGKMLFEPFDYQVKLMQSYHDFRFNINLLPRQAGKCFSEKTTVRIKHKETSEEYDISIGDFFEMQKNNSQK